MIRVGILRVRHKHNLRLVCSYNPRDFVPRFQRVLHPAIGQIKQQSSNRLRSRLASL